MTQRIVLAFSGDAEARAAVPWLKEQYGGDVVAVTLDLGQGRELEELRDRALASGALRAHALDVRDEFARDFILPALRAGALRDGRDPMAAALAEPLVVRKLVELAQIEHAAAVAYGGGAATLRRVASSIAELNPELRLLAPVRDGDQGWGSNLWGRSIPVEASRDTWTQLPDEVFTQTRRADETPDAAAYVEISFEQGTPVAINGIGMSLTELIESLSIIAGQHGIGRIDAVEDGPDGKMRRAYEAPAALVLHAAHRELEALALPYEMTQLARELGARYAQLVHEGRWFSPTREALDAFFVSAGRTVTGMVRVKMFKGQHSIAGRRLTAPAGTRTAEVRS